MKAAVPLLVIVLIVGILNLLQGFGVFGGKTADTAYTYEVYTVDEVGMMIKYLIDEDFKGAGKTEYSSAILDNPRITLPRLMNYMSGEGWELVEIKGNGLHVFRRATNSKLGEDGAPRLSINRPVAPATGGGAAAPDTGSDAEAAEAAPAPAAAPAAADQ